MKTLRDIFSLALTQALGAVVGFVFGALLVAFARDPIERVVIPRAMAMLGSGQVLEVYFPDPKKPAFDGPDTSLSVYWPGSTDELSGRVIQRKPDGKEDPDAQSVLTGFRQTNVLSFTYRTVAYGKTGIGAFFGTYDPNAKVYIGTLTGYAHPTPEDQKGDAKASTAPDPSLSECSVEKGIAILGDPEDQGKFLALANAALARNRLEAKSEDPNVADAPSGSEKVVCVKEP